MSNPEIIAQPLALLATEALPSIEFRRTVSAEAPAEGRGEADSDGLDRDRPAPSATRDAVSRDGGLMPAALPDDEADAIRKQLLRQKLFSRRAKPVTFGRFKVLDVIGQGGMGIVYACYDDQLERKVAVKVLLGKTFHNVEIARARLLREAQAMARLSHPNIVTVLEVGTVDDQLYVAMEFVPGLALDAWIAREPRSWREVLAAYLQAGRGLEAAHRANIIHRDFKPQNVLITPERVVKVLDFGLARASEVPVQDLLASTPDDNESHSSGLSRSLTRTGAYLGTPLYMSYEQHCGEKATAASDQFSYCVSLYESLYRRHPFTISSVAALRCDLETGTIAAVPPRSSVPPRILKILRRGLSVDPKARFASMSDLLAELARDPEARRRRIAMTAALAGCVGVASFTAASARIPALEVCPDAIAELHEIWGPARVAAVQAALVATGSPRAAESWAIIEPMLAEYAAAWVTMRNEACLTHAEQRQSDPLFDLRTACLDQRRAGFAGLVDSLAAIDAASLDRAVPAVGRLPALAPCADAEALTAAIAPPTDPTVRAQVQGLRESLARAETQEHTGRYRDGLATVETVRTRALTLDYPPLLAEALLRQGSLQMEAGDPAKADAAFGEALLSALTVDHKPVAAQAISKRIFVRAERLGQAAQAVADLPLATALNTHVAGDIDLYSEFLNNVAVVHLHSSAVPEARRALQAALALRVGDGRERTLLSFNILNNLGAVAKRQDDTAAQVAVYRQLVASSGPALGEHHPWHLTYTATLAQALARAGRPREARNLLGDVQQRLVGDESVQVRGWVGLMLGDLARGSVDHEERDLETARRAYQAVISEGAAGPVILHSARTGLGFVAALEGREPETRALFASLLAETRQATSDRDPLYFVDRMAFGAALVDLGQPQEAIEHFEFVLAHCAAPTPDPQIVHHCIWSRYQLGRAYQQLGDHAAAERTLMQPLGEWQQMLRPDDLNLLALRRTLAEALLGQARFDAAATLLRADEALYAATVEPDYIPLARTRFALARALAARRPDLPPDADHLADHLPAALADHLADHLADQALAAFTAHGPAFASEAGAVTTFIARHTTN